VPTTPPGLLFLCSPRTSAPWRAIEEKRRDGTGRDERSQSRDREETAGSRSSLARGPAFTALPLCRLTSFGSGRRVDSER
jgi:hypothetical protein